MPGVAQGRGAIREPPRRLELGRDVGELELDRLELRDGLAELHALPRVVRRHVEHGLGQAERQRGDRDAPDLERAQELAEPHRRIADEVIVGDPDVVEEQLAGVETAPADAAHLRAHGEAGGVLLHDEARERRRLPLARLGAGQQRHPERHVGAGVGDERLPTVDQPATVAPHRPRADAARVRTRIGLGQAERAEDASLGQRSQPTLSLRVVAEEVQRQRTDRHVRLPRGGHRLVGQADLLHRGDEADGRHADAAPLLGDQHAEQAQRTHLAEQVGRAPRLLPRQGGAPGDLLLRELATEADQIAFRLGEREVHGRILLDRPVQRLLSIGAVTDYDAIDFFRGDELVADPYPYFDWLRAQCPVQRERHHGVMMVTGYDEAIAVYNDTDTFSSCNSPTGPFPGFPVPLEGDDVNALIEQHRDELPMSDQLLTFDPPIHTAHRALLMRLITPKRLRENEEFMWRLADRQIDEFIDRGDGEFIRGYGQPFAMLVVADLLGVPESDHELFRERLGAGPSKRDRHRRQHRRRRRSRTTRSSSSTSSSPRTSKTAVATRATT